MFTSNWAQPFFTVYEDLLIHCEDGSLASMAVLFACLSPSFGDLLKSAPENDIYQLFLPGHKASEVLELLQVGKVKGSNKILKISGLNWGWPEKEENIPSSWVKIG